MPATGCSARSNMAFDGNATSRAVLSAHDAEFLAAFMNCTLPEAEWTHEAHVRLAWICLVQSPPDEALARIRDGILGYNTDVLGRAHKYHETITVAFTRLIGERLRPGETWLQFRARNHDLVDVERPILGRYYSAARLTSDAARRSYVDPDREPLPEVL